MNIFQIEMMLHFACSPTLFRNRNCEAYRRGIRDLLHHEMIQTEGCEIYTLTARGRVYVEAIKNLPFPVQSEPKWIMP